MASSLRAARRSKINFSLLVPQTLRYSSTLTPTKPSHHNDHTHNHVYLKPNGFLGSWETPKDPKEAEAKLSQIRRDYAKQVKELRKQYIHEMDLQREEQMRKDEARREEILLQREERKKSKAAAAQARAAQRAAFEQDLRQTLMKERQEKLEYWKMREKTIVDKKRSKKELIRRQSSVWIDERELEKKILEAIVDTKIPKYF